MPKMTRGQRLKELNAFVDLCFATMEEPDLKEIANRTGLSVSTLYRLATRNFTLAVQFGTIQALGYAAGLRLEFTEYEATIALT